MCVCVYIYMHACMLSRVQLFVTFWAVAHQAPPRIYILFASGGHIYIYIYIYPYIYMGSP